MLQKRIFEHWQLVGDSVPQSHGNSIIDTVFGISPDELEVLRDASKAHVKETHTALKETVAKLHKVDKMYKARPTLLKNKNVYKQFLESPKRKRNFAKNTVLKSPKTTHLYKQ